MGTRRQCERALELHEASLGARKNVVGLGIAPNEEGELAVAVYVSQKVPEACLDAQDIVPKELEIPGRGRSKQKIRTTVVEQGQVGLEPESE